MCRFAQGGLVANQDEKAQEKEEEKRQEKSEQEKDWRRDTLGSVTWAVILIWAGIVLLGATLDVEALDWLDLERAWAVILVGAALILGAEIGIRLMVPAYAAPIRGLAILAVILGLIGLSNLVDVSLWPLILVALGIGILLRGLTGGSR
jgi:hypothetical protein